MTYEEITEQATANITDFMDRAKASDDKYSANLFAHAAWGAKIFWRNLAMRMYKNDNTLYDKKLWNDINKQDVIFDKLIDRESVPALQARVEK